RNKQIESAHMQYGYTLKEIADQLKIHYTTVSKVLKR
ncbi:MAG TPA: addiction module toxin RelE, partial [Desulfocapsa sulfexigens]|nr:addiction module toxin RelE [Desulfocapsa sulfexigens]